MKQFKQTKLDGQEKMLFEKAIKFYFFSRQKGIKKLPDKITARFKHNGHVAYSLIIKYLEDQKFHVEYMDYLNREIRELLSADTDVWEPLQIAPQYIDDIQLQDPTSLSWTDEQEGKNFELRYRPTSGELSYFAGLENGSS